MFEQIDLEKDVDSIVYRIEKNCEYANRIRKQIKELKQQPEEISFEKKDEPKTHFLFDERCREEEEETDEEIKTYIDEYRRISGDDEESLIALLPDPEDYQYVDIIYRLQAESLKEIKEMTEIDMEMGNTSDDSRSFIENEKKKINCLRKLLETEEEKEEQVEEKNNIILAPTESGRIRVLDDINSIPLDFYGEAYSLIQSVINGTFKRLKRFNHGTNITLGGVSEVRGQKVRVIFQRLNKNTYAIITTFLKKTTNDHGYQEFMKSIVSDYRKMEDRLKSQLDNPEFMELNEQFVQELWNKLGYGEEAKTYGKGGLE